MSAVVWRGRCWKRCAPEKQSFLALFAATLVFRDAQRRARALVAARPLTRLRCRIPNAQGQRWQPSKAFPAINACRRGRNARMPACGITPPSSGQLSASRQLPLMSSVMPLHHERALRSGKAGVGSGVLRRGCRSWRFSRPHWCSAVVKDALARLWLLDR